MPGTVLDTLCLSFSFFMVNSLHSKHENTHFSDKEQTQEGQVARKIKKEKACCSFYIMPHFFHAITSYHNEAFATQNFNRSQTKTKEVIFLYRRGNSLVRKVVQQILMPESPEVPILTSIRFTPWYYHISELSSSDLILKIRQLLCETLHYLSVLLVEFSSNVLY